MPSLDARAMSAIVAAAGPAMRSQERIVRTQRDSEGASSQ